jgi:hypothetical protein
MDGTYMLPIFIKHVQKYTWEFTPIFLYNLGDEGYEKNHYTCLFNENRYIYWKTIKPVHLLWKQITKFYFLWQSNFL